ncbi:Inner kinetochore subunit cnp20 [Colletotrichum sidae]|uniref:Inner kinetochore subunit cnp20 n=1 Tax=Colletotrichum sidae TaxID=1347389 RepID=A0A4R8SS75_9PEZI|nr:Inner kinetochore subunit cnp20 [Colletotrichum sidae]
MSFNTPTARGGPFSDPNDDPLFSSALLDTATARTPPARRALSLEPPSSLADLQTPSNPAPASTFRSSLRNSAYRGGPGTPGLLASGRRSLAATPHARAAYRTIDQRRAAALTPGGKKRRESIRPRRESLHDVLRGLSRATKHATQPISSSSSPNVPQATALPLRPAPDQSLLYDEDDDDLPIDRPRLSLPLDVEDEDDDLVPPRLSEVGDENATIEFPRRAFTEQDRLSRLSMGSARLGEFRNFDDFDDDDNEAGGFDPGFDVGGFEEPREQEDTLDRIEDDPARRETIASARESDFGFQVPLDADQTTFVMAVEGQSSPVRPLPEITDEQPSLQIDPLPAPEPEAEPRPSPPPPFGEDMVFDDLGPGYEMRSSSPADYTGLADVTDIQTADADATEEDGGDDAMTQLAQQQQQQRARKLSKRGIKLSKHGMEYPSLPPAVVKRLAGTFARSSGVAKTKLSPEALVEIQRASDWFFEQLGDDLSAYAKHAKRKTIDESDMLTLMRRQRQTNSTTTPFSLAQRHLPRELLQELRMPKPLPPADPRKKRRAAKGAED